MSTENTRKFFEAVEKDEELAKRLSEANSAEEFFDKIVEEGQKLGISLAGDELKTAIEERTAENRELSDEELESVAGGAMYQDFRSKLGQFSAKIVKGGIADCGLGSSNCGAATATDNLGQPGR